MTKKNEPVIAWVRFGYALPVLTVFFLREPMPVIQPGFWPVFFVLAPLELLAYHLYIRAIRLSPLSVTLPFLAFTPVFLLATAFLFLGELPTGKAVTGVLLVSFGCYLLHFDKAKTSILEPVKAVLRERGSRLMLAVAFIYSLTASLGKLCVIRSTPIFFGTVYFLFLTMCLFPISLLRVKGTVKPFFSNPLQYLAIGLAFGLSILCHFNAVLLVEVPLMISVKRTSLLFGVVYGHWLFGEKEFSKRLIGATVMFAGLVVIVLSNS